MTGARFVHDQLELRGWDVEIADAAKVKGIAPLVAKTDRIDARVLAELVRRDLVSEIWLPIPGVRCMSAAVKWTSSTLVSNLLKLSVNAPESTGR
jgi:transposase